MWRCEELFLVQSSAIFFTISIYSGFASSFPQIIIFHVCSDFAFASIFTRLDSLCANRCECDRNQYKRHRSQICPIELNRPELLLLLTWFDFVMARLPSSPILFRSNAKRNVSIVLHRLLEQTLGECHAFHGHICLTRRKHEMFRLRNVLYVVVPLSLSVCMDLRYTQPTNRINEILNWKLTRNDWKMNNTNQKIKNKIVDIEQLAMRLSDKASIVTAIRPLLWR